MSRNRLITLAVVVPVLIILALLAYRGGFGIGTAKEGLAALPLHSEAI